MYFQASQNDFWVISTSKSVKQIFFYHPYPWPAMQAKMDQYYC